MGYLSAISNAVCAIRYPSGCLVANPDSTNNRGRPTIAFGNSRTTLARFMCEVQNGPPNFEGAQAGHTCHTPLCIEPTHLKWVNHIKNIDMEFLRGDYWKRAEAQVNTANKKRGSGIYWRDRKNKTSGWVVHFRHRDKAYYGGPYKELEAAERWRDNKYKQLGIDSPARTW